MNDLACPAFPPLGRALSARARAGLLATALAAACALPAFADPSPAPAPAPAPPATPALPNAGNVLNNPYVQSVLNALGGVTQTTNGPAAFGRVTYFKRFDLQLETAPTVYRKVHLHQGTVIDPRGATIVPGVALQVNGMPQADGSLNADTITLR